MVLDIYCSQSKLYDEDENLAGMVDYGLGDWEIGRLETRR